MKKVLLIITLTVLAASPLLAREILVLKNGKKMVIDGTYEVKGQWVVITEANGELRQLPLKVVDLDKSKEVSEAERQRMARIAEEKRLAKAQQAKVTEVDASMSEIAEYVERHRTDENPVAQDLTIENKRLETYSDNNPRPTNTEAEFVPPPESELSLNNIMANRDKFGEQYQTKKQELDQLMASIEQKQLMVDTYAANAAAGDDYSGGAYDAMERTEKEIVDLRKRKTELEEELANIKKEARRAGVRGVERYKGKEDDNEGR